MSNKVILEKHGFVGRIILNDPERLNALCLEMAETFPRIVKQVQEDKELRCVIVTGAGRAFSAGGNLDMIGDFMKKTVEMNREDMVHFYGSFLCIRDIEVPTIAYLNGHAVGAGFCLALACDLRIASEEAKMGLNFSRLGLSPGMGGSWVITQLAGYPVAADLIYSGRTITASEAYRLGLVNEVHSTDQATAAVQKLAETIANNAPIAVREAKKVIQANVTLPLDQALKNEAKGQAVSFQTQDLAEGIQAIREKREPNFKGK